MRQLDKWYVLDTSAEAHVWTEKPRVTSPEQKRKPSRGYAQPVVIGTSQRVADVIAAMSSDIWRRNTAAVRSQGPAVPDSAEMWVWFSEEGIPGPRERLLV